MDDESPKEVPQTSTSMKENQRESGHDSYDDRQQDEEGTNSETTSATYSVRSRTDIVDARIETPKPPIVKREREMKAATRKRKARRAGRVEKRRRSITRRQLRKTTRRRMRVLREGKKERNVSVTTLFSRMSPKSESRTLRCLHCGHRCCRRR